MTFVVINCQCLHYLMKSVKKCHSNVGWKQLPKLFSYSFSLCHCYEMLPADSHPLLKVTQSKQSEEIEVISIIIWPFIDTDVGQLPYTHTANYSDHVELIQFQDNKMKKTVLFDSFETNMKVIHLWNIFTMYLYKLLKNDDAVFKWEMWKIFWR